LKPDERRLATSAFHFGFVPLGRALKGALKIMSKTKQDNNVTARNQRSAWARPSLRRLATSEAENNPTTVHPDAEGFIS
jgi:hypothetical protein